MGPASLLKDLYDTYPNDPINQFDLSGQICWSCHVKNGVRIVKHATGKASDIAAIASLPAAYFGPEASGALASASAALSGIHAVLECADGGRGSNCFWALLDAGAGAATLGTSRIGVVVVRTAAEDLGFIYTGGKAYCLKGGRKIPASSYEDDDGGGGSGPGDHSCPVFGFGPEMTPGGKC